VVNVLRKGKVQAGRWEAMERLRDIGIERWRDREKEG